MENNTHATFVECRQVIQCGNIQHVRKITDDRFNVNYKEDVSYDEYGWVCFFDHIHCTTLLHSAVLFQQQSILDLNVNPNITTPFEQSELHLAAMIGNVRIAEILILSGIAIMLGMDANIQTLF